MTKELQISTAFDSKTWREQHNNFSYDNPRYEMVINLRQEFLLTGLARSEARELLGPPEQERARQDTYRIGVSPFGIDFENLIIEYDVENRLDKTLIVRD